MFNEYHTTFRANARGGGGRQGDDGPARIAEDGHATGGSAARPRQSKACRPVGDEGPRRALDVGDAQVPEPVRTRPAGERLGAERHDVHAIVTEERAVKLPGGGNVGRPQLETAKPRHRR